MRRRKTDSPPPQGQKPSRSPGQANRSENALPKQPVSSRVQAVSPAVAPGLADSESSGGRAFRSASIPAPEQATVRLKVNGADRQLKVMPWTSLLDVLREQLALTGTKKGCDQGQCGACTVLVDGKRI